MSPDRPTEHEQVTPDEAAHVDAVCDRFESAWKEAATGGPVPSVASYLGNAHGLARDLLLRELVALDRACRERYGHAIPTEDPKEPSGGTGDPPLPDTRHAHRGSNADAERPSYWPSIPGLELVDVLGSGGMGVVFKARQVTLGREVAVKCLRDDHRSDPRLRERFLQEARAVARLRHPHLVQLYEFGEVPGAGGITSRPYLVLEYVHGGSLAELTHGSPQPPREAARLVETLADAIHYAHQQGVIHRDLKPANVLMQQTSGNGEEQAEGARGPHLSPPRLLTADLCAKVTDFGLAKFVAGSDLTRDGEMLGTPSYMAPEQTAGNTESVTTAVDVYGLGAVLYEALSGRPPFAAAAVEVTLAQVRQDTPVPPRRLQPTVPRDLETICLKCLEKDPRRRYASAAALAEDLCRFLAGEPILARPLSVAGRLVRWVRRHPTRAALLTVSVIAALASAGAAVGVVYNNWLQDVNGRLEAANGGLSAALGDVKAARDGEAAEKQRALEALGKKERLAALLRVARAGIEVRANRMADARRLLTEVPVANRGWEWRYLWDQSDDHAVELRGHDRPASQIAFDPVHSRAATAGMDSTVRLWDTTSARELARLSTEDNAPLAVAFSPDGARLAAAGHDGRVRVWATPPGEEPKLLHTLPGHQGKIWSVAFSPDGKLLASAGNDQTVRIWDAASGAAGRVLRGSQALARRVTIHARRNAVLAVFDGEGMAPQLWEWDPATGNGQVRAEGKKPDGWLPALAVRPDSGEIAVFLGDGTIKIWTAEWRLAREVSLDRDAVDDLAWSSKSVHLAVARRDGSVHVFDTFLWGPVSILPRHGGEVLSVAFDPASRRVASCGYDGRVILADAVPGRPPDSVTRRDGLFCPTFRADGLQLAAGGYDGTIWLFDPATCKESAPPLPAPPGLKRGQRVRSLAFSPVGAVLAAAWKDDPVVRIWNGPNNGPELRHDDPVSALAFRHDGGQLATASRDEVRLWDPATGRHLDRLKAPPGIPVVCAMAYHPNGRHLIGCGGQMVDRADTTWVWDLVAGGSPRGYRKTPEEHQFLSFGVLPDGMVPGPTRDFGLSLFDPTGSRQTKLIYPAGTGQVWAVHPDGRLMAITRRTGGIALWDSREDAEVYSIPLAGRTVAHLAFDPPGRRLVVNDNFGNLFVFDAPPEK
jgi:serine/threonine protein kinase/WD40 repeat protein